MEDLFQNKSFVVRRQNDITCKCVMLRSMFIAEVSQFSETYL